MKNTKTFVTAIIRISAILMVMLFALSAASCGKLFTSLDKITSEIVKRVDDFKAIEPILVPQTTDSFEYTDTVEVTVAPETTAPAQEIGAIPIVTTAEIVVQTTEAATVPVITLPEVANEIDGKCTHEHYYGEAEALYAEHDVTLSEDDILHLRNERLVIAYGGLRLREEPNMSGTQVGLLPDGTIIHILARQDRWAYTYYDGVYGWCSMEYLYEPFYYETAGGAPLAFGTVTNTSGTELYCAKKCCDKNVVSTKIPYSAKVEIYSDVSGGPDNTFYVSYKGTLFGTCKAEDVTIEKYNY